MLSYFRRRGLREELTQHREPLPPEQCILHPGEASAECFQPSTAPVSDFGWSGSGFRGSGGMHGSRKRRSAAFWRSDSKPGGGRSEWKCHPAFRRRNTGSAHSAAEYSSCFCWWPSWQRRGQKCPVARGRYLKFRWNHLTAVLSEENRTEEDR